MTCPANCHNARVTVLNRIAYRRSQPVYLYFKAVDCPYCTGKQSSIGIAPRRYVTPRAIIAVFPELRRLIRQFPRRNQHVDSTLALEVVDRIRPPKPEVKEPYDEED